MPKPRLDPRAALDRALAVDRALTLVGLGMLALLVATLVGLIVDSRIITGAPAWLKPAKFAASFAVYAFTILWLLHFVQGRRWLVRAVATVTAVVSVVEVAIIAGQAARGLASHYNQATALDRMLFNIMGGSVAVLWLMGLLLAVLLLVQRLPNATFAWSLRLGLLVTLVGMALGFLMTMPTLAQQAALAAGQPVAVVGAHSVGVADGGPGLPVIGWSTEGGDLRAAHFVGLHALQALPLFGWLLARHARRLGSGHRTALVWLAGLAYLGLVLLLTWQALRGQSVIAPDAVTLSALLALIGATALIGAGVLAHGLRPRIGLRPGVAFAPRHG
jgi:hypothetical protein